MENLKVSKGQRVYILSDADENYNYSKVRIDIVKDIYTEDNDEIMLEFTYLPCDLPYSEMDISIFVDEKSANKVLEKHLIKYNQNKIEKETAERKARYSKYKAVYNIIYSVGIGIIDFEYGIDDYCINEWFAGPTVKRSKNKIYTDIDGRQYIKKRGSRYYLDEFIRTDI